MEQRATHKALIDSMAELNDEYLVGSEDNFDEMSDDYSVVVLN